jgi:hypothetical protein
MPAQISSRKPPSTFSFQYAYCKCDCGDGPTHIILQSPCYDLDFVDLYFLCMSCGDFQRVHTPMKKMDQFARGILNHPNNRIPFFH